MTINLKDFLMPFCKTPPPCLNSQANVYLHTMKLALINWLLSASKTILRYIHVVVEIHTLFLFSTG